MHFIPDLHRVPPLTSPLQPSHNHPMDLLVLQMFQALAEDIGRLADDGIRA